MIKKSYTFRLMVVSIIGMLPLLGFIDMTNAADVGSIQGTVTGQRTSASMSGVKIKIMDPSGKVVNSTLSQKDGTFTVSQVPVGQYDVKAGEAPVKSIKVAMSPPVTQVDFQVPERGYLVFSGLSKGQKIALVALGVTAAVVGGLAAGGAFSGSSSDTVLSP